MHRNLMEVMREQYYPLSHVDEPEETTFSENLQQALEEIRWEMEHSRPFAEFYTYWTDLPDDYVITTETLDELKRFGFRVVKRYCDKGTPDEHYYYIVAWDDYDEWPFDEPY